MLDHQSSNFSSEFDELLARARSGCPAAMNELLGTFLEPLHNLAMHLVDRVRFRPKSPSDFVQEVLLKAFEHFNGFRGVSKEELLAWLRAMLRNLLSEFLRAQRRRKRDSSRELSLDSLSQEEQEAIPDRKATDPCEAFIHKATSIQLKLCFAELSEAEQTIITLHFHENFSFLEIAKMLFISETAARQRYFRAHKRLGNLLAGQSPDEE